MMALWEIRVGEGYSSIIIHVNAPRILSWREAPIAGWGGFNLGSVRDVGGWTVTGRGALVGL